VLLSGTISAAVIFILSRSVSVDGCLDILAVVDDNRRWLEKETHTYTWDDLLIDLFASPRTRQALATLHMESVVLPRRARTRQHLDLYPWRAQHEPQDHNTYSWWSPIGMCSPLSFFLALTFSAGEDARAEADAVRTPFTRKYL
jgi:hypothetical protein